MRSWQGRRLHTQRLVIVVVAALGIAVLSASSSIVARLLESNPGMARPDRLMFAQRLDAQGRPGFLSPEQAAWVRDNAPSGLRVSAVARGQGVLLIGPRAHTVVTEAVDDRYFDVLGVQASVGAVLGDSLSTEDEFDAVISERLWRASFGGAPTVVGSFLSLHQEGRFEHHYNDEPLRVRVVGIVPSSFHGISAPWAPTELWYRLDVGMADARRRRRPLPSLQLAVRADSAPALTLGYAWMSRVGRTVEEAGLATAVPALVASPRPPLQLPFGLDRRPTSETAAKSLLLAVGWAAFLVAVWNAVVLDLAAGVDRERDVRLRLALGATPWRLLRGSLGNLTATLLAAGAIGWVLGASLRSVFEGLVFAGLGEPVLVNPSWREAWPAFLAVGVLLAAILISRAGQTSRIVVSPALINAGVSPLSLSARRTLFALCVPQAAVSIVLLAFTISATSAVWKVANAHLGWNPDGVVAVGLAFPEHAGQPLALPTDFGRSVLERIRSAGGSFDPAMANMLPWEGADVSVLSEGRDARRSRARLATVTADYFKVLGIPLVAGLGFVGPAPSDHRRVVVDRSLAVQLWGAENPAPQRVAIHEASSNTPPQWLDVVGIVGAVAAPHEPAQRQARIYLEAPGHATLPYVVVKGHGVATSTIGPQVRDIVLGETGVARVAEELVLTEQLRNMRYALRGAAILLSGVALVALVLSAAAVFAVLSLIASRRESEFGTMLALGAQPSRIRRLVFGSAVKLALAASALSIPVLYAVVKTVQSASQPEAELSWRAWAGAVLVLALVMAAAAARPARRAANTSVIALMRAASR